VAGTGGPSGRRQQASAEAAEPGTAGFWHAALFYRDAAEFEAEVCRFAEAGARAGSPVLVATAELSRSRLRARLSGLGDRVTWVDLPSVAANPGRLIPVLSGHADQHPGLPVWCVQQAAWPSRSAEELREVLRYEALLNLVLAGRPARVLCPYRADLPGELVSCAEAAHPVIARDSQVRLSPRHRARQDQVIPPGCDLPLPAPPATAQALEYRDDLRAVRRFVSAHAHAAGLPPRRVDDLILAAGELAANTLVHTAGAGNVAVWVAGGEIICQVSDAGQITSQLAGQIRPDPAAAGGQGLWLVHQLGELVQIRSGPGGTTVRVHMRLAP
jgi:anti-sigma regulatory factor (Ser/Thr protein kinase)